MDPMNIPRWNLRVADVVIDGPVPLRTGSRYRYSVVGSGRAIACSAKIVDQQETVSRRTEVEIGTLHATNEYRFAREGDATRITARLEVRATPLHALVLRTRGRARIREDLARMKAALESLPT